jgi:hypothetical protein
MSPIVKGFGCRPLEGQRRLFVGRRPKASKGGNRAGGCRTMPRDQMRPTAGRSPQSWRHRHWRKYGQQRISSWNNRNVLACTEPWLRPKQQVVNHKQPTQNAVDDCPKYRMIFGVRNHLSFLHRSLSADLKLRIVAGSGVDRARRDSTVIGSRLLHLLVEAAGQGGVEGESHAG